MAWLAPEPSRERLLARASSLLEAVARREKIPREDLVALAKGILLTRRVHLAAQVLAGGTHQVTRALELAAHILDAGLAVEPTDVVDLAAERERRGVGGRGYSH